MSDGQLGDAFVAFFGGNGYQEIKLSEDLTVVVGSDAITFKQRIMDKEGVLKVLVTAQEFKVLAEILLPNITQTTTINVEEVKKKLTPISKD